jgi:hypothetical protein
VAPAGIPEDGQSDGAATSATVITRAVASGRCTTRAYFRALTCICIPAWRVQKKV